MIALHPMEIVDVLGNRRLITRRYGDGSFDCPHCGQPVVTPALECEHPWCPAHPGMPIEAAERHVARVAQLIEESDARIRNLRLARERVETERTARELSYSLLMKKVRQRGACRRCAIHAFERGRERVVRHRGPCPRGEGW